MNHRIANAHVLSRLAKYRRVVPHGDHNDCPVCVASRQAQTGAVSVGERIAACLKSCDCPPEEAERARQEYEERHGR